MTLDLLTSRAFNELFEFEFVESSLIILHQANKSFKEEFNAISFNQEWSWEWLRNYPKWDKAEPVDPVGVEGHTKLFGHGPRLRPSGASAAKITKLKSYHLHAPETILILMLLLHI